MTNSQRRGATRPAWQVLIRQLFALLALAGLSPGAWASVAGGLQSLNTGDPSAPEYGELVFNLFNGLFEDTATARAKHFAVDTGIRIGALLADPEAFNGLVINVASGDPDVDSITPETIWSIFGVEDNGGAFGEQRDGVLVVVSPQSAKPLVANLDDGSYTSYGNLKESLLSNAGALNDKMTPGVATNDRQIYIPSDAAFFGKFAFGLGGAVTFDGSAPTSVSTMPMYYLRQRLDPDTFQPLPVIGGVAGREGQPVGYWTFEASGKTLSFSTSGKCSQALANGEAPVVVDLPKDGSAAREAVLLAKDATPRQCDGSEPDTATFTFECADPTLRFKVTAAGSQQFADYPFRCRKAGSCDDPWIAGTQVGDGQTRSPAVFTAANSDNCAASAVSLTCRAGKWFNGATEVVDPRNQFVERCNGNCPLPWGGRLAFGGEAEAYQSDLGAADNCADVARETLVCDTGGVLRVKGSSRTPTFRFPACAKAKNCEFPGGLAVDHGKSVVAYAANVDTDCEARKQVRSCANGILDGDPAYQFRSCGKPFGFVMPQGGEVLRVGFPTLVQWRSLDDAGAKRRVTVAFSTNGGKRWRLIRTGRFWPSDSISWRPKRNQVGNVLIRVCLAKTRQTPGRCEISEPIQVTAAPR